MPKEIFIVAGEASADLHGAALLTQIRHMEPAAQACGVGGTHLIRAGMNVCVEAKDLNIVGFTDWLDRFSEVYTSYRRLVRLIRTRQIDCAVLIDLPDLNLLLAKHLKAKGIPVIYYISPQIWAWRKYRLKKIRDRVDRMLVVFPFEEEFYKQNGVQAHFVGHPLVDSVPARTSYRSQAEVIEAPRIAILPGSRRSELKHHTRLLIELVNRLLQKYPRAAFSLPVAPTLSSALVKDNFAHPAITLMEHSASTLLHSVDFALVASGTATLECALVGTPLCLFYIVSPVSASIFKTITSYRGFLGMPNLLLGQEVVREFIQERATVENLFCESVRLIEDMDYRSRMTEQLTICRQLLGNPGAAKRAAAHVVEFLNRKNEGQSF
ncbi:MAG: lipid-A-disaccharide synthase [Deltaproteobacteria bacterium]|nr:lipid-A-disaccharide synthase [Deltaproteobacteria bacterium]